jgi:hypothetical protein
MDWWGGVNNPLVKAVGGFCVMLFLALNFPAAFLIILAGILFYAIALLGVVYTYRSGYRNVGRSELALKLGAKALSELKEYSNRTVARGWERHQSRETLKRERKARLRRYERERNRRKRQQTREALTQQRGISTYPKPSSRDAG